MRTLRKSLFSLLWSSVVFWATPSLLAAEESAFVTEGKINVRGKPGFIGEVITQLERGDKVTILERINLEKPKAGEPTNWAKIKLPQNTPAWVFAPFVKDGKVAATRLNLRAGPGENYSVIGRMNRGDAVLSIRTVEEWIEIEAPENSYAFIDLTLVRFDGTNAPSVAAATLPARTPPIERPQPLETEPATTTTPIAATVPPAVNPPEILSVTPEETIRSETAANEGSTATNLVSAPPLEAPAPVLPDRPENLPQVAPPLVRKSAEPLPKRIVRREGLIRATKSIQAPTWYELAHAQTGKTINYLYEAKLGLKLKDYRGQKVMVSGEEAIDPRWPNTPILDLETLDVLP